jgi:hypothetical protein
VEHSSNGGNIEMFWWLNSHCQVWSGRNSNMVSEPIWLRKCGRPGIFFPLFGQPWSTLTISKQYFKWRWSPAKHGEHMRSSGNSRFMSGIPVGMTGHRKQGLREGSLVPIKIQLSKYDD